MLITVAAVAVAGVAAAQTAAAAKQSKNNRKKIGKKRGAFAPLCYIYMVYTVGYCRSEPTLKQNETGTL